jgi:hypothetical protein
MVIQRGGQPTTTQLSVKNMGNKLRSRGDIDYIMKRTTWLLG